MTIMTTIVAVAIGLIPVNSDGVAGPAGASDARLVGRYTETVDARGNTHLSGFARQTGKRFDLVVEPDGDVHGSVGNTEISFHAEAVS